MPNEGSLRWQQVVLVVVVSVVSIYISDFFLGFFSDFFSGVAKKGIKQLVLGASWLTIYLAQGFFWAKMHRVHFFLHHFNDDWM